MAADYVEGTIKIIAEVVGNSTSPIAGTGSMNAKDEKNKEDQKKTFLGIEMSMKNLRKILGVAGILSQSKIIASSLSTITRLFGAFMDMVLAPLVPLMVRGFVMLGNIVRFVQSFMKNPGQALKDAWAGLVSWFHKTWEEQGGFWGVLMEAAKNVTGLLLITGIFGAMTGLISPVWMLKKLFRGGYLIAKSALKAALGLTKFVAWQAPKFLVQKGWMVSKMFGRGVLFTATKLRTLFGFAKAFVMPAVNAAWWGTKIFGGVLIRGLVGLASLFGFLPVLGAALLPFLLPLLITGLAIGAFIVLNMILDKVGFYDWLADITQPLQDWAEENLRLGYESASDAISGNPMVGKKFFDIFNWSLNPQRR